MQLACLSPSLHVSHWCPKGRAEDIFVCLPADVHGAANAFLSSFLYFYTSGPALAMVSLATLELWQQAELHHGPSMLHARGRSPCCSMHAPSPGPVRQHSSMDTMPGAKEATLLKRKPCHSLTQIFFFFVSKISLAWQAYTGSCPPLRCAAALRVEGPGWSQDGLWHHSPLMRWAHLWIISTPCRFSSPAFWMGVGQRRRLPLVQIL